MEVFGGLVEVEESEFQEEERPSLLNPENEVTDLSPPEASDAREQRFSTYWLMPYELNPYFVGREQVLEGISNIFLKEDTPSIKICAISGLPGIGKTQVAIAYTYRQRNKYQAVFWVRADDYENIVSDFVDIAHILNLPEKTSSNRAALIHAVEQWLAYNTDWLIVFDNVEHLELVTRFFPVQGSGHIILTLRSEVVGRVAAKVEISPMEIEEGAAFLLSRANIIQQAEHLELQAVPQQDREHARTLSKEMDGLPLALDQAGAYIEELFCSLAEYIELYRRQRNQVLQRRGDMSYGHPASIVTTISLALEKIRTANRAAVDLLYFFAHLHPDRIQKTILRGDVPDLNFQLQALVSNPASLNEALGLLSKYGLIRKVAETAEPVCFRMHRLVQDVLQDLLETDTAKRQWAEQTIQVVNRTLSSLSFANWQSYHEYISHAQVCVTLIEKWNILSKDAVALLSWVAAYWHEQGDYTKVQPLLEKIASKLAQIQEPDQLDILENMNQVASFYLDQKKYKEAEKLYLQVLAALESKNSDGQSVQLARAAIYHNIGELYDARAEYEKAESNFVRSLALREHYLGLTHELCAVNHYNLAELYSKQEDYERAETHHQCALQIRRQRLEPGHPSIAESLNGIGANLVRQHRYKEAEPFFLEALQMRQKAFGPNHWSVAQTLGNLGNICMSQQKLDNAENYFRRALQINEQISTSEDGDMTDSLIGLGFIYFMRGRVSEAKSLFEKAAALRKKVLGPDHPETIEVLEMIEMLRLKFTF